MASRMALPSATHRGHNPNISRIPHVVSATVAAHASRRNDRRWQERIHFGRVLHEIRKVLQVECFVPQSEARSDRGKKRATQRDARVEDSRPFPIDRCALYR